VSAALFSAWAQGETYDEPAHIAYARRLVETGETERLSVLHFNSKTPGSVPNAIARQAAKQWLGVRGPGRLLFFARLPTVLTLAVLLAAVFVIGRRFLGEAAACLATTACALDPNLIANSSVATVDTLYALATLLTLGPAKIVTADSKRRLLTRKQTVVEHFTTSGTPVEPDVFLTCNG